MKKQLASLICISLLWVSSCEASPAEESSVETVLQTTTEETTTNITLSPTPTPIPYIYMPYEGSEAARAILSDMTLEEKVYQMLIVNPETLTGNIYDYDTVFNDVTSQGIAGHPVGGLIFFGGNILSPEQITEFISSCQNASEVGLFIAIDEEGGDITRIASNNEFDVEVFPPMGQIQDEEQAYIVGSTIGEYIADYGFNLNFAPVADVNSNPDNPVIGERSFSGDPLVVAQMVRSAVRGFNDSGVFCTLKHFPGHGDTVADTHIEAASISRSYSEMLSLELVPFAAGIEEGADFIMAAHITTPNADPSGLPASLSYFWLTEVLRYEMGFEGIIVTDSMSMAAITDNFSPEEAAVMAVYAGCDILLMPEDPEAYVRGIIAAVEDGILPEDRIDASVLRIIDTKIEGGIIQI